MRSAEFSILINSILVHNRDLKSYFIKNVLKRKPHKGPKNIPASSDGNQFVSSVF